MVTDMNKAKEYINSKTNSILKYSVNKSNRDIVSTIVYNELTDLSEFSNTSDVTTPIDNEMLERYTNIVSNNLYSDKPLKLEKYCNNCKDKCFCDNHSNSFPDCFILGLELENGTPYLCEQSEDGIILLEVQRKTECNGKLVCDCSLYSNILGPIRCEDGSVIELQCGLDLLLEGNYNNDSSHDKSCNCCYSNGFCNIMK